VPALKKQKTQDTNINWK